MNSLQIAENMPASIWLCSNELKEIKEIYGKNLSDNEFKVLVNLGKATGLNPALREIWAVKYGDNPAQIFIGRDGYRRSAQANPDYDYHHVEAVYTNDEFYYDYQKGFVTHKSDLKNRGALLGAYCIVEKKSANRPTYIFVEFKEYNTGKSLWASKPVTMIKKVAEAQCLRMAFQQLFGGTYAEEEIQPEKDVTPSLNIIQAVPVSQAFKIDDSLLQTCIAAINSSKDMNELKNMYADAIIECRGDRNAMNEIAKAKDEIKKKLKESEKPIITEQTTEEFLQQLVGDENVAK